MTARHAFAALAFAVPVIVLGLLASGHRRVFQIPRRSATTVRTERAWNVVVITLDTTRADRIGAYGRRQARTPNLDRLARDGVLFERAEAVAPLTLPAHCSLFTGRLPFEHGLRDNGGRLDPREITLAQGFHAHGYNTAAFVSSFVLDARWGLDRGFDVYDGRFRPDARRRRSDLRRSGDEVVDRSLRWLNAVSESPFFLWVHFYDAHAPYDSRLIAAREGDRYDDAIAFVDSQVGRLLEGLARAGVRQRTLIVVAGDHGESLGEHGERTHGLFLYEGVTHIPLIIQAPATAPVQRVHAVVSAVDIAPTILELVGLETGARLHGRSLVAAMNGADTSDRIAYAETMYPRYHFGWSELYALRHGRYKLIAAPRPELYDLETDPGEEHNVFAHQSTVASSLRRELMTLQRARPSNPNVPVHGVETEVSRNLISLGYVSTGAPAPPFQSALPDPKDKLDLYNLITNEPEWAAADRGR